MVLVAEKYLTCSQIICPFLNIYPGMALGCYLFRIAFSSVSNGKIKQGALYEERLNQYSLISNSCLHQGGEIMYLAVLLIASY